VKEKESEFEKDRQLDIHNLHTEYQGQADRYGKWSGRKATASKEKYLLEERLKALRTEMKRKEAEVRAKLDLDVRKNWDNPKHEVGEFFDCKKPTESAIANWIIQHPDYKQAQDEIADELNTVVLELAEAIENVEYLEGAVFAMSQRKNSIEGEINLWVNGYYADPKIPKTLREEVQKETQRKIKKSLTLKKT